MNKILLCILIILFVGILSLIIYRFIKKQYIKIRLIFISFLKFSLLLDVKFLTYDILVIKI